MPPIATFGASGNPWELLLHPIARGFDLHSPVSIEAHSQRFLRTGGAAGYCLQVPISTFVRISPPFVTVWVTLRGPDIAIFSTPGVVWFSCSSLHGFAPSRLEFSEVLAPARIEWTPAPRPESPLPAHSFSLIADLRSVCRGGCDPQNTRRDCSSL